MRPILALLIMLAPSAAYACDTYVSPTGVQVTLIGDPNFATITEANGTSKTCDAIQMDGEEDFEPALQFKCAGAADEVTFAVWPHFYTDPKMTFRGETFTRSCD